MAKLKLYNTHADFLDDYREFKRLLKEWKKVTHASPTLYLETKPLDEIEGKLAVPKDYHNWCCPRVTLIFREIDLGNKLRPIKLNTPSKIIEKRVRLTVECEGVGYDLVTICNPLRKMEVDFTIEVDFRKKGVQKQAKSAWHLDKHSDTAGEASQNEETDFLHPEYHFHFGGKKLINDSSFNLSGNLLLLGSPRIQHFPMDLILAIDFIIQNFYSLEKRKKLVTSEAYKKIIRKAKERLWRPYIYVMAKDLKLIDEPDRFSDISYTADFGQHVYGAEF